MKPGANFRCPSGTCPDTKPALACVVDVPKNNCTVALNTRRWRTPTQVDSLRLPAEIRHPSCTSHSDSQPRRSPHRRAIKLTSLVVFAHPLLGARVPVTSAVWSTADRRMGGAQLRRMGRLTERGITHSQATTAPAIGWRSRFSSQCQKSTGFETVTPACSPKGPPYLCGCIRQ